MKHKPQIRTNESLIELAATISRLAAEPEPIDESAEMQCVEDFKLKIEACDFARTLAIETSKATAALAKTLAEKYKAMAEAHEARATRIAEYMLRCMEMASMENVKTPTASIWVAETRETVIFDEAALISWADDQLCAPEEESPFYRTSTKKTPVKDAIKSAILGGMEIPGATVKTNKSIQSR